MPGIYAVLNTLAQQVENACYPAGIMSPSVTGNQITIEAGFPIRTQLDKDLQLGYSHVFVYPDVKQRAITKFEREYLPLQKTPATLVATVSGMTVTITGTVTLPQSVMVIVNGTGYGYGVVMGDTVNTVAAGLAALIPGAVAVNNVVTVASAYSLIARISTNFTAGRELARIEGVFNIYIESPNPEDRAVILDAVDTYLKVNFRIVGSDDFYLLLFYHDLKATDELEKEGVYKARLMYMIQYPTTQITNFTSITQPFVNSLTVAS